MKRVKGLGWFAVCLAAVALAGCGGSDDGVVVCNEIAGVFNFNVQYAPARLTITKDASAPHGYTGVFEFRNNPGASGVSSVLINKEGQNTVRATITFSNGTITDLRATANCDGTFKGQATTSTSQSIQQQVETIDGTWTAAAAADDEEDDEEAADDNDNQPADDGEEDGDDDDGSPSVEPPAATWAGTVSGTWSGRFLGSAVDGTFTMTVNADNSVDISYTGDSYGTASGNISSSGDLSTSGGGEGYVSWTGTFSRQAACSGTWTSDGASGTWTGNYQ